MSRPPPSLRRHASGHFFCRWGGRDHYLGKEKSQAQLAYTASIRDWAAWRADRLAARPARISHIRTVAELAAEWFIAIRINVNPAAEVFHKTNLAHFTSVWGRAIITQVTAAKLQAVKADMLTADYAAASINHMLRSTKRFLLWCSDSGHCQPINLRPVPLLKKEAAEPKARPLPKIREFIDRLSAANPALRPWLSLHYLCGLRTSEVARLVNGQGHWHEPENPRGRCVWSTSNKIAKQTGRPRYIVLSPEALDHLAAAGRHWQTANGYSQAVAAAGGKGGANWLRSCAWTHLRESGLELTDVQFLLGHSIGGAWRHYERTPWHNYQPMIARLTLKDPQRPEPPPPATKPAKPKRGKQSQKGTIPA